MRSVSIYYRNGTVFIVPQAGLTDVGPLFTASIDAVEVAAALRDAIAVDPAEQVLPSTVGDHQSPLMVAMNVKSNVAFERGLKLAVLRLGEHGYQFFRFVPHPKFKSGFRREDDPTFTMAADAPLSAVSAKVVEALEDETWPMKKSQLPPSHKH